MLLPYDPNVISGIITESINQVIALTTKGAVELHDT